MNCVFTFFLTVFQSNQDDEWVKQRNAVAMEPGLRLKRSSPWAGLEPGTARSAGQRLTHWATGAFLYVTIHLPELQYLCYCRLCCSLEVLSRSAKSFYFSLHVSQDKPVT